MESDYLHSIAERTFLDIISSWVGVESGVPSVQNLKKCRYYHVTLPSLWHEVPPLKSSWIIFASEQMPKISNETPNLNCECFELSLEKYLFESVQELCRTERRVYFCLALMKKDTTDITSLSPLDRFEWYIIDLSLLFKQKQGAQQEDNTIPIPIHNTLNLALFSLVWSSQWVSEYYSPFYDKQIFQIPNLLRKVQQLNSAFFGITDDILNKQRIFLSSDLATAKNELDPSLYNQLFLRLGLIVGLNEINYTMNKLGDIGEIFNYAPEALYGTANFWLFSRVYHSYMEISSKVASPSRNIRLLPMFTSKIDTIPAILRAAVWHVMISYRNLMLDVRIVHAPDHEPGKDRNYYGGGIGHYPWLTISDTNLEFGYVRDEKGDEAANRDFLEHQYKQKLLSGEFQAIDASKALNISRPSQLELSKRKPVMLFPKEDLYFEHPRHLYTIQ